MVALSDAYATVEEYRAYTGKSGSDDDYEVGNDLVASSRMVDLELGYRDGGFSQDDPNGSDVERIYVPDRSWWVLDIDPIVTCTTISVDGVAVTGWELLPRNPMPYPDPFKQVARGQGVNVHNVWVAYSRISILGKWGWPAIPESIKSAVIELTAIRRIESARATNRIDEMGQVTAMSRTSQGIIDRLLATYRNPAVYI